MANASTDPYRYNNPVAEQNRSHVIICENIRKDFRVPSPSFQPLTQSSV